MRPIQEVAEPVLARELHRASPGIALWPEAGGRQRDNPPGAAELGQFDRPPTADRVAGGMGGL
jgi:hypothetical protein